MSINDIKIFAKNTIAAAAIVFAVANLVFGDASIATVVAMNAFALAMINSARLDMIESKPRININITREEDSSEG